jgi:hypothetical protein
VDNSIQATNLVSEGIRKRRDRFWNNFSIFQ